MRQSPDEETSLGGSIKDTTQATFALGQMFASPVEIWLRQPGTVGERVWGPKALVGLAAFMVIGTLASSSTAESEFVLWFIGMTLVFMVGHKHKRNDMIKQGHPRPHSHYNGVSRLQFGDASEFKAKQIYEPTLVIVVALFVGAAGATGFAAAMVVAAIASATSVEYDRLRVEAMRRTMSDQMIEQEMMKAYLDEMRKK